MNRVIAAIKKIRLGQILMTLMAGVLLFVSTACNGPAQAKNPNSEVITGKRQEVPAGKLAVPAKDKNPRPEVPGGTATSPSPDVINTFRGGPTMNEFSDVDPRAEGLEKAATQRGQELSKNAAENIHERGFIKDEGRQYVRNYQEGTPFGERVKNLGEDISTSAKELTGGVSKGTQQGVENIKGNTEDATKGVARGASSTAEDAKSTAKDLTKSANRAVENTSDYVQAKTDRAAQSAQRNLNKASEAVKDTID